MTVFTNTWDETIPPGTESISLGDNRIREFKNAIRERLAEDHAFYQDETGHSDIGLHKKVSLIQQGASPTFVADSLILFAKEAGGYAELHNMFETNNAYQLTYLGRLWIEALKIENEANKDLIRFNGTKWTRYAWATLLTDLETDLVFPGPPKFSFQGLKVIRLSDTQVRVTADELVLENVSGQKYTATSLNVTGDITVSGANGLDAGAEASDTWYYVWVISDGTTEAALLSASSTNPTMPAGYTYKALVGAVRNDSSGDFIDFKQYGREFWYYDWQTLASGAVGLNAWTTLDTSALIPSGLSTLAFGVLRNETNASNIGLSHRNDIPIEDTISSAREPNKFVKTSVTGNICAWWKLPILTANTLYWGSDNSGVVSVAGFILTEI